MDGRSRERLWREVIASTSPPGENGWANAVCRTCVTLMSGVDAAALTLRTESRAQELLGASDSWAETLGEQQYTLGEGPGVDAFRHGGPVLVPDFGVDQGRWPGFAEAAMSAGADAAFAFPLQVGAIRLGTLELFRRRVGDLPPRSLTDAAVLADLATLALLNRAENVEPTEEEWTRPVTSYQDVNIATGMLAAQLHLTLDEAFARLRAHAFSEGRSVLAVARDVMERRVQLDRRTR
ncbi:ANTAR domain-containing protein [Amycolatopsis marina]|uniref:ANTAR domain-containing protein n=1 Tax=Amycolatopsis marina TaxID=490629 RepID=A0A1I0Z627_9PSEU|nr:ANTAR domain-containing protein [Amycolatopsis marina]SFB19888.1 ANTAR domain-containing protein [Amycolatopsis marina]